MNGRRATAADVAAAAGVSRSTVSYILNGSDRQSFSPETVARVRAAAAELAYLPHAAARALRKGQSGIVLLVLPDVPGSTNFAKLVAALTDAVRATGRSLVTLTVRPGNRLVDALRDISPQALLEVLPLPEEDSAAALAANVPVVVVTSSIESLDRAAGALQVEHLAALGHRRLGILTVSDAQVHPFSATRLTAATAAVEKLGLAPPRVASVTGPPDARAIGAVATTLRDWTTGEDPVTAVCCFNDLFAAVTVAAARSAGLDVPGDLSIVGMDDEPLAGLLGPTLTTVRYDFTGTGAHIRERLRHALDDGPAAAPISSDAVRVVERESTAPVGGEDAAGPAGRDVSPPRTS
ncbi:LacI family DNA-binding transcriptional regulator [Myceligenerans indicum]|uniref:LacI family transcriptional regulator n=1 Tax=Myceligenerans indicum TaxID=2593663 RepID=A0ABS1LLK7_9MICO|nr:LacI family DNA-binding transcriptional regulator [Myceligenerans indicum]MBL0887140.1 LacI family transcriptional regulator [Myceligenerans indicum]